MKTDATCSALFYKTLRKHKLLTIDEEKKYSIEAKEGSKEAIDKMIICNQRLVTKIALDYIGRGIDIMDLLGEGSLGLMKAINMFEPDRGFRFSTYATWWIKYFIRRTILNNSRTVRLPSHTLKKVTQYSTAVDQLTKKLQRQPTLKEIAKKLEWKIQKVSETASVSDYTVSTDSSENTDDRNENNLYNYLESPDAINPADEALFSERKKLLYAGIRTLKKDEQTVILKRFGFLAEDSKTLNFIGKTMGVTREMVRKHQVTAIDKLRNYFNKMKLNNSDVL